MSRLARSPGSNIGQIKTDTDSMEDFQAVYDFDEAFNLDAIRSRIDAG